MKNDDELSFLYVADRAMKSLSDSAKATGKFMGLTYRAGETIVGKIRSKQMLEKIEKENAQKRNVFSYGTRNIDQIDLNPYNNILVTGDIQSIRVSVLEKIIAEAVNDHCPLIVLHTGNPSIENIVKRFGGNIINQSNKIYDPFFNRSSYEVYKILLQMSQGSLAGMPLKPEAYQYITAMNLYMQDYRKNDLTLQLCSNCPHNELMNKANQAYMAGQMPQVLFDKISQAYMAGQSERFSLMSIFEELKRNVEGIGFEKSKVIKPYNIRCAVNDKRVISIAVNNPILLDILACEIDHEITNGKRLILCMDNVYINKNKTIFSTLTQRSLNNTGGGSIILATDMLNMCSGDEKLFADIYSTMDTTLLARHPQGKTVEQWSSLIGDYEKTERSWGNDSGKMRQKSWEIFAGTHQGSNQSFTLKRERILKQEDITSLKDREVYYISKVNNIISRMTLMR